MKSERTMRSLRVWIFGIFAMGMAPFMALAGGADTPVVVELYTSQGCSSCPPADEFLGQLAKRSDVIALSLHVDYWDYIGWKDEFADPSYTKRQKGYARVAGSHTIYTPQLIVGGKDHVMGNSPASVDQLIRDHQAQTAAVGLTVQRNGNQVQISAANLSGNTGAMAVQLVRYHQGASVKITRGENAGRTIAYHNVVTDWKTLQSWDGSAPLSINAKVAGNDEVVVIIQQGRHGPILAAARLR